MPPTALPRGKQPKIGKYLMQTVSRNSDLIFASHDLTFIPIFFQLFTCVKQDLNVISVILPVCTNKDLKAI